MQLAKQTNKKKDCWLSIMACSCNIKYMHGYIMITSCSKDTYIFGRITIPLLSNSGKTTFVVGQSQQTKLQWGKIPEVDPVWNHNHYDIQVAALVTIFEKQQGPIFRIFEHVEVNILVDHVHASLNSKLIKPLKKILIAS